MGLTGLQIYKLLPKTNCRDCNYATCMAFAMALAAGKASLEACPHVSEEAKATLGAAAEPPMRLVTVGQGSRAVQVGGEVVLFRHDKTFYHPPGVAVAVRDDLAAEELRERMRGIRALTFERIGVEMRVDLVAVENVSGDKDSFVRAVEAAQGETGLPLILKTGNPATAAAALDVAGRERPLLWGAGRDNLTAMLELAKKHDTPLVLEARRLDELAQLSEEAGKAGHKDLLLAYAGSDVKDTLQALVAMRRMALVKRFRPFGFPAAVEIRGDDVLGVAARAAGLICRYGSILVLDVTDPAAVFPLLVLRQDIYTDPQKPIQVEATCYPIGNPGPDAPVLVTTNFSLTYFTVAGEIEASRVPAYLITVDTDGTSVLTAWAAGKFGVEQICEALRKNGIAGRVNHRKVIIPGYVAALSGRLAEVSGWEVIVGPREASALPAFLRANWPAGGDRKAL